MADTVRKPRQHVQEDVLVRGENIADVRAIQDIFESGEDANPD